MTALDLLAAAAVLTGLSGLPGLFRAAGRPAQRVATVLHVLGCAAGTAAAGWALAGEGVPAARFAWAIGGSAGAAPPDAAWSLPIGQLTFTLDRLSAFFLVPVFVVAGLGSIYGEGYFPEARHPESGRRLRLFYGLVTAGLAMVMAAGDAWAFLIGWEVVGLSAFFLVTTDQDDRAALRAGWIYLVAAHAGTLLLFATFTLLHAAAGSWALAPSPALAGSPLTAPILLLALAGFGLKAGVMPLHIWLPEAHAAAPSHVSALLSGVVLKMGIYGLARLLSMLPEYPTWLGLALVALGISSGVLGVVLALAQHDLKRLLAYHSIENIGIILIGFGAGALGVSSGHPEWAVLGFAGGLLHVWNHAAFKALLFYAAGAVIHATGTREIDKMGGLYRRMRVTGTAFLAGAVAICGLPPLNGFASEWLIYLASFRAIAAEGHGAATLGSALGAPALALIGGLAVACFVKAFSVVFLGVARRPEDAQHHGDATPSMRAAMLALVAVCLAIGLWPAGASAVSRHAAGALLLGQPATAVPALGGVPLLLLSLLALGGLLIAALTRRRSTVPTWDCGYAATVMKTAGAAGSAAVAATVMKAPAGAGSAAVAAASPRIQYTASSFAQILVGLFGWAVRPDVHRPRVEGPFPASGQRFESHAPDPVLDRMLVPALARGRAFLGLARVIQGGRIQTYLVYIAVTLVVLLAWSAT